MAQAGPVGLGDRHQVAAQVPGEVGDEGSVLGIGAVPGVVLPLTLPMHEQGLHAHQGDPSTGAPLRHRLPPVAGGLAGHDEPVDVTGLRHLQGEVDHLIHPPRRAAERPPGEHLVARARHHDHLLGLGQVDGEDRRVLRHGLPEPAKLLVTPPVPTRESSPCSLHSRSSFRVGLPSGPQPRGRTSPTFKHLQGVIRSSANDSSIEQTGSARVQDRRALSR